MNTIFRIFTRDVKGLLRNFLALVVVIGVCILPSLYAWFNIYSNWDPYGNTAAVKIAVVSEDEGYEDSQGEYNNIGQRVIDNLRENDKLGWTFLDSKDDAIHGVESGDYYAAIVIGDDFSYSLYNFAENDLQHPSVSYYQNEKKNAIAIKITDTGKSTLQTTINQEFVNTVVCTILETMQDYNEGEGITIVDKIRDRLIELNDNLVEYDEMLTSLQDTNKSLANAIYRLDNLVPSMANAIDGSANTAGALGQSLGEVAGEVGEKLDTVLSGMQNVSNDVVKNIGSLTQDAGKSQAEKAEILKKTSDELDELLKSTGDVGSVGGNTSEIIKTQTQIKALQALVKSASSMLESASESRKVNAGILNETLQKANEQAALLNKAYREDLVDKVQDAKDAINVEAKAVENNLSETAKSVRSMTGVLGGIGDSVLMVNDTLLGTQFLMDSSIERIQELIEKLDEKSNSELYKRLNDILHNDPELYGAFLAEPVEVTTVPVYEVENYGSGVTPFYTTLALWVGGILLVSVLKVHAEPHGEFQGAKHHQLFLGRYLLFFVLGQVQSVICVLGNIYLLKIQCLDVPKFFLACSVISFVFTLLIFTLTNTWGDIGKALVVVLVVMQIAGSSGTYPIEILPSFYQKLYVYFPFPYAINSLRECVAGMYENTYWIRLGQLLIFAGGSLLLGLLIRIPFIEVNEFVEERMKDTKMM